MLFRKNKKSNNDEDLKFLVNVPDDVAASIVKGLLNSYDISVKAKMDGDIGWLRIYIGSVLTNVDLYVRQEDYNRAKYILDNQISVDEDSEIEGISEE